MPTKNYYVVLGVSRDESSAGIRSTYHELARRMQPDTAGPANTTRFQEINESYEVLSDPNRRRQHDHVETIAIGGCAARPIGRGDR